MWLHHGSCYMLGPMETEVPKRLWALDVDGTLIHLPVEIQRVRDALAKMFRPLGVELEFVPLLERIRQAAQFAAVDPVGTDTVESLVERAYRLVTRFEVEAARRATPCPGLGGLIRALGQEPVVLVSNNSAEAVRAALATCGLAPARLASVIGRIAWRPAKPDPAPLLQALGAVNPLPGQLICVGDRPADMAMAVAAAGSAMLARCEVTVTAVGVLGRLEGEEELRQAGAERVFPDLPALVGHFF